MGAIHYFRRQYHYNSTKRHKRNSVVAIFVFYVVMFTVFAHSYEPMDDREPEVMKKLERLTPVWVVKIGGSPSFGDYLDMFLGENLGEQELRAMWNKQTERQIPDEFIVKRIYEYDEVLEVGISFDLQKFDYFHDGLKLGSEYIVFFHKNAEGYYYDACNAISVKFLKRAGLMPDEMAWPELVSAALENKLFSCM